MNHAPPGSPRVSPGFGGTRSGLRGRGVAGSAVCPRCSPASLDAVYLQDWISDGELTKFHLEARARLSACARRVRRSTNRCPRASEADGQLGGEERETEKNNNFYLRRNSSLSNNDSGCVCMSACACACA